MTTVPFKLSDAAIGLNVAIVEPIGDEIRWTYCQRIEGAARFSPKYVPVRNLRTVQGRVGCEPRWDSGELSYPSEMPGNLMVVDAIFQPYQPPADLMIVHSSGWIGIYLHGRLVHTISSNAWPSHASEPDVAIKLIQELGLTHGTATALWSGGAVLPQMLSDLKLEHRAINII